jgi:hypothetical protein
MTTKDFAVFDGDSHVVEPPGYGRSISSRYSTLGRHELWQQ